MIDSKTIERLVLLWRKEAKDELRAERAYLKRKPRRLKAAAFEKGLALAKQQCADQLENSL